MNPLNLDTYSLSLLAAKEDIVSGRSSTDWAIFTYEKSWSLKLQDSGAGGLEEFIKKLSSGSVLYGLCRVTDPNTKTPRTVLIYWVGEHVDESQREISRNHLPAVQKFFKEANALVSAQRVEDLSLEAVVEALTRSAPPVRTFHRPRVSGSHEGVGTNYRKTNPAAEMRFSNRESFWERSEREEERRKEEERLRIVEERIALEKERIQRERAEEEERERRIREKERLVEEQRKEQARLEAEKSRMEKARWVQQQKEYEEEMRGRFKRSQSIEMAAEAALLVSHRTMHPRDFFRQQERSVSCSSPPSTPNSPSRSPQGFFPRQTFRYQRSLTESILPQSPRSPPCSPSTQNWNPMMSPPGPQPLSPAFIFSKSALPATSPRADSLPSFIPPPIALNRAGPFQNKTSPPSHVQKVTSPKLLPQDSPGRAEPDAEHPQSPLEAQPPHNRSGDLSQQAGPLPPSTTQAYTTVEKTLKSAPLTVETTLQTTPPSTDIIPQIASSTVQTTPLTATPTSEIIHQTAPSSVETTLQTSSAMEEMPLQITPLTSVTIPQTAPSIAENTFQTSPAIVDHTASCPILHSQLHTHC
ncbi:drebrin-like protein A [Spea bombifrons]|uniref:drebrin-like protein A n=1 Tax=Spea bombifrons TaxID=233779 RepID=UPI002349E046|nr:drebrin-like protein A [Spea bombifrons]